MLLALAAILRVLAALTPLANDGEEVAAPATGLVKDAPAANGEPPRDDDLARVLTSREPIR